MLQNCNIYPVHANFVKSSKRAFAKCYPFVKLYLFCKGCINLTPFKQITPSYFSYLLDIFVLFWLNILVNYLNGSFKNEK